jgi:hypothetical protein
MTAPLIRHARAAALCGVLLALVLPAAAHASTVKVSVSAVKYQASGGENNRLKITQDGDVFTFVDTGAVIQPGPGCLAAGSTATCTLSGATQVVVYADDQDDLVLASTPLRVKLYGQTGHDVLAGGSGDDLIEGDDGDDRLAGGAGADALRGNLGSDVADYSDRTAPVRADPDNNADDGADGEGDSMEATVEGALGGEGDDELTASDAGGTLVGGAGNDRLRGDAGSDLLDGGLGRDELSGQAGDDTLRSRDLTAESPDCGEGADRAEVDLLDNPSGCEAVDAAALTEEELNGLLSGSSPTAPGDGGTGDGGAPGDEGSAGDGRGTPERPENHVLLPANPISWAAPGVALLRMQCSPAAVDGCRGDVILEITRRVRRRSARAVPARGRYVARQHRVGRRRFSVGSGKPMSVRVRLTARGNAILRNRRRVRGRIRIKHRDAAGHVVGETTRTVAFTARKWGRRRPGRRIG